MIPLSIPDRRGREAEYLASCARDNWVSSAGPFVTEFEKQVIELAKPGHAAALQLAPIGAGVRNGDHIVVPD